MPTQQLPGRCETFLDVEPDFIRSGWRREKNIWKRSYSMNTKIRSYAALTGLASIAMAIGLGFENERAGAARLGGVATVTTVATGLNNPRGLNFASVGALFVAEAGSGGVGPCGPGPEGDRCFGTSGSLTRIDGHTGAVTRPVINLP